MKGKSTKKKVAIYIRVSTLDQAREGYSLDAQENTLRKWCADNKCEVFDIYADRGISGKDMSHRPDMGRLMRDAHDKKFNIVLFWALSRFTRSVSDLYYTMEVFKKLGIDMISHTESFDTITPMGRAMTGIVGIFAQLEREICGERVALALAERAHKGKRTTSYVLGYDKDGKDSFVINSSEAEYVRFCFESYLKYKNLSEVALLCNQRGYHGKRGKAPNAHSVSCIIINPLYCGYHSFKGNVYKGTHEPIVSVNVYNKVQRLLKSQGKISGRTRHKDLIYIRKS